MKNFTLFCALGLAAAVSGYACGSDVNDNNTTAATGSGGSSAGGAPTSSSSVAASSSSAGGAGSVCDQACAKLDMCVTPGACGFAQMYTGIDISDCSMMESECVATCLVDADCAAIGSLLPGGNPDPMLTGCLASCQGDTCFACMYQQCNAEVTDCSNDMTMACPDFVSCIQNCMPGDGACINQCAVANDSPETQALVACASNACPAQCLGQGGGGGAGGQGGN